MCEDTSELSKQISDISLIASQSFCADTDEAEVILVSRDSVEFKVKKRKLIGSEVFKDMFDSVDANSSQTSENPERITMIESGKELVAILPWFDPKCKLSHTSDYTDYLEKFWFWTLVDKFSLRAAANAICCDVNGRYQRYSDLFYSIDSRLSTSLARLTVPSIFVSLLDPQSQTLKDLRLNVTAKFEKEKPSIKDLLESVATLSEIFPLGAFVASGIVKKIQNRIHSVAEFNLKYCFNDCFSAQCHNQHGSQAWVREMSHPYKVQVESLNIACGKCRGSLKIYGEAKNKFLDSLPPLA